VEVFENKQGAVTVVTNGGTERRQANQLKSLRGSGVNLLAVREKFIGRCRITYVVAIVASDS
jgi:hypothetical protein